jgi:hypothetical protein
MHVWEAFRLSAITQFLPLCRTETATDGFRQMTAAHRVVVKAMRVIQFWFQSEAIV